MIEWACVVLCWFLELWQWWVETLGGIQIQLSEVKFLDLLTMTLCESICHACFHWSRMKVRGSKMIRYRLSLNHKLCQLEIGGCFVLQRLLQNLMRNQSLWVLGGVWSQDWNLKELTEGHHQVWSLRLNLTQHGETYQEIGRASCRERV